MRKRTIRIITFVLAIMMLVSICSTVAFAEPTTTTTTSGNSSEQSSKKYATSLIDFTRSKNDLDINRISTDELRVFGTFLSNFYIPFSTQAGQLSKGDFKETFKKRFFGNAQNNNDADITKILQLVDNGMTNNTEKLYVKNPATGAYDTDASLQGLVEGRGLYRKSGELVFGVAEDADSDTKNIIKVVLAVVLSADPDNGNKYITDNKEKTGLTIDPFGNIAHNNTIIIPGCMNPYTYLKTSDNNQDSTIKLPVNNAFMMGSFVQVEDSIIPNKQVNGGLEKKFNSHVGDVLGSLPNKNLVRIYGQVNVNPNSNTNVLAFSFGNIGGKYNVDTYCFGFFGGWSAFDNYKGILHIPLDRVQDDIGDFISTNAWEGTQTSGINTYKLLTSANGEYHNIKYLPMGDLDTQLNISVNGNNTLRKIAEWVNSHTGPIDYANALTTAQKELEKVYAEVDWWRLDDVCKWVRNETQGVNTSHFAAIFGLEGNVAQILAANSEQLTQSENSLRIANNTNAWGGIYWAYLIKILGFQQNDSTTQFKYTGTILPTLNVGLRESTFGFQAYLEGVEVDNSAEAELQRKQQAIVEKVYNLLDEKSNAFRNSWIKASIDDVILTAHNSMVGSDFAATVMNIGTGNNSGNYQSVMGYVTTPSLDDLPYTAWFFSNYTFIYAVLMSCIAIFLILSIVVGYKDVKSSLIMFLILAMLLLVPKISINTAISVANTTNEAVFGDRFEFWAVSQHQQNLQNQKETTSTVSILDDLQKAKDYYGSNGLVVKWMAPKKQGTFDSMLSKNYNNESVRTNTSIFRWLFAGELSQEIYSSDPLATYLYRPYSDIAATAATGYSKLSKSNDEFEKISSSITSTWRAGGYTEKDTSGRNNRVLEGKYLNSVETGYYNGYLADVGLGERYNLIRNDYKSYSHIIEPLTNTVVNKGMFNSKVENLPNASIGIDLTANDLSTDAGGNMYLLYTESPYYYFYNVFKNVETQQLFSGESDFARVLLSEDFFKVKASEAIKLEDGTTTKAQEATNVDGELKDFLDLEGLFTYIIPYLHYGNSYVEAWGESYGIDASDISISELKEMVGTDTTNLTDEQKEAQEALIHKQNLEKVWNLYSPWVDAIYDTRVYNQKAKSANQKVDIYDALNPEVYNQVGRPMAFGPADMIIKGYNDSDLTDVEEKINAVLEDTYKDLLYLNNYYGFDNEVLVSVAAMTATFNFNKHFSDVGWFSNDIRMNPQSFELNNMNYDAFLRLVLLNATGEPLISEDGGLYERVISKTSVFTGIVLVVVDFIAIYIVPLAKIILLVALLILGILFVLTSIISPFNEIKTKLIDTFFKPLGMFFAAMLIHGFIISMCVGEGVTDLVGSRSINLATNDPTIMLLLLLCVDSIYAYVLIRQIIKVYKQSKELAVNLGSVVGTVVKSATAMGAGALFGAKVASKITSTSVEAMHNYNSQKNISKLLRKQKSADQSVENTTIEFSHETEDTKKSKRHSIKNVEETSSAAQDSKRKNTDVVDNKIVEIKNPTTNSNVKAHVVKNVRLKPIKRVRKDKSAVVKHSERDKS